MLKNISSCSRMDLNKHRYIINFSDDPFHVSFIDWGIHQEEVCVATKEISEPFKFCWNTFCHGQDSVLPKRKHHFPNFTSSVQVGGHILLSFSLIVDCGDKTWVVWKHLWRCLLEVVELIPKKVNCHFHYQRFLLHMGGKQKTDDSLFWVEENLLDILCLKLNFAIWFTLLNGLWNTEFLQKCVFSRK